MKATNIAATIGPPALTTVLRMALPLIPELTVREQTGVQRSASARRTDEADHVLGTSYHARYFMRQASDRSCSRRQDTTARGMSIYRIA
jgi:hypothetical protein